MYLSKYGSQLKTSALLRIAAVVSQKISSILGIEIFPGSGVAEAAKKRCAMKLPDVKPSWNFTFFFLFFNWQCCYSSSLKISWKYLCVCIFLEIRQLSVCLVFLRITPCMTADAVLIRHGFCWNSYSSVLESKMQIYADLIMVHKFWTFNIPSVTFTENMCIYAEE